MRSPRCPQSTLTSPWRWGRWRGQSSPPLALLRHVEPSRHSCCRSASRRHCPRSIAGSPAAMTWGGWTTRDVICRTRGELRLHCGNTTGWWLWISPGQPCPISGAWSVCPRRWSRSFWIRRRSSVRLRQNYCKTNFGGTEARFQLSKFRCAIWGFLWIVATQWTKRFQRTDTVLQIDQVNIGTMNILKLDIVCK